MKFERPTAEDEASRGGSRYGEANHESEATGDERTLYGEPCHEMGSRYDEQTLYGEPQHETSENPELPDVELLFARMRVESVAGPTVLATRDASAVQTTER